tara:strand:+ start:1325 stop:1843 length:519 start_codon:yes stop_codon:yes gene_type:complete
MQKSKFIAKIKDLAKVVYAEKSNPLADAKEIEDIVTKFPVINKFPPLKAVMDDLFDFQYEPFVKDIQWVAPRPTTFRVMLVNGADFYLIYQGESAGKGIFIAQVAGKKYFLESLPEEQQASEAIARLLRYNYAVVPKGEDIEDDGLAGALEDTEDTPETELEPAVPDSVDDL